MAGLDDNLMAARVCNRGAPTGKPSVKQNCFDVVNFSVFFDGTGNNKEVDDPLKRWSNPARLWRAAQVKAGAISFDAAMEKLP